MRFLVLLVLLALIFSRVDCRREPGFPEETPPAPSRPDLRPCPLCGHGTHYNGRGYYCDRCVYLNPES